MSGVLMRNICLVVLIFLIIITGGCYEKSNIAEFKSAVKSLISEFDDIEAVQKEVTTTAKGNNSTEIRIDLSKRAKFYEGRKEELDKILKSLDVLIASKKLQNYQDDALFCRAFGLLYLSNLDQSGSIIDDTLHAVNSFLDTDESISIEEWTQNQLKKIIWDKLALSFSKELSEKQNLNQFFLLSSGSIYQHRKKDLEKALSYYNKAVQIAPNSVFGQQAVVQIEQIEGKKGG